MIQNSLKVLSALKVKIANKSAFATKDYYILIDVVADGGGDDRGDGRADRKPIFFDDKTHRGLFTKIDKMMEAYANTEAGKAADVKWEAISKDEASKKYGYDLPESVKTYGYMVNFKLPAGRRIIRQNGKKEKIEAYNLNLTCFGAADEFDANGNLKNAAWGESPADLYQRLVNNKVITVEEFNPDASTSPDDIV